MSDQKLRDCRNRFGSLLSEIRRELSPYDKQLHALTGKRVCDMNTAELLRAVNSILDIRSIDE